MTQTILANSSLLLILGASTRAAAASAVRAGFHPVCADRFGDEDLRRIATVFAVNDDLRRTLDAVNALPQMPWMYTGSVENDPELIAAVSQRHTLLGNPPSVLQKVRDPFWLERTLRAYDLPALHVRPIKESLPSKPDSPAKIPSGHDFAGTSGVNPPSVPSAWLFKPTCGGGGYRIAVWSGQAVPTFEQFHLQEHRVGTPMSALFVANEADAELIGVCEQLIGFTAGAPTEFGYAGSIGPIVVSDQTRELLQRFGNTLTRESQLRGLFGIDFVLAEDIPWLVELNPRYTASVEVFERAFDQSVVSPAPSRQRDERRKTCATMTIRPPRIVGKQILFATSDLIVPSLEALVRPDGHTRESLWIADIPKPDSMIAAGWPICTIFAEAATIGEVRTQLAAHRQIIEWALISMRSQTSSSHARQRP